MADTLSVEIKSSLQWLFEETLGLSSVIDSSRLDYVQALADGTAAGQADVLWHDTRTLAAAASENLDLTALAQTIHGSPVTVALAKLKGLLLVNTATAAGEDLVVDGTVANGLTSLFAGSTGSKLHLPAGGSLLLVNPKAGWAVTAGAGDLLRLTSVGAGAISYQIVLVGTSS